MENNNQLQKYTNYWLSEVQEITVVKEPYKVRYCGNDQIVVTSLSGQINCITLEAQKKQNQMHNCSHLKTSILLQVNSKKIIMGDTRSIGVYDRETTTWDAYLPGMFEGIRSIAWNSLKNTFFACYGEKSSMITRYNYVTNEKKEVFMPNQIGQIMTMHPQQKIICLADYSGNISLRNVDDTLSKIKTIDLSKKLKACWFCQYSLDGSRIIVGSDNKLFIINPDTNEDEFLCVNAERTTGMYEEFKNIAFHPKGSILAILCYRNISQSRLAVYKKQLVRYLNIKTGCVIGESSEFDSDDSYDVCFADNGFEGTAVLKNKCVRIHISFAIKDKCIYSLYVLNTLKDEAHWPRDIVRYCGNMLLESFKF
jgi:WD40 repeat protein